MTAAIGDYEDELFRRNAELEAKSAASLAAANAVLLDQRRMMQGGGDDAVDIIGTPLFPGCDEDDSILQASAEWQPSGSAEGDDYINGSATPSTSDREGGARQAARGGGGAPGGSLDAGSRDDNNADLEVPGNQEATVRLLRARVRALDEELTQTTQDLTATRRELQVAQKEGRELAAEKTGWQKNTKALEAQVEKFRKAADEARAALSAKESALAEAGRDVDRVHRERKNTEADARSRDVRLNRALEEVDRYKRVLTEARQNERDAKDGARRDYDKALADNKKLERQKAELLSAFRKQMKLIDVLKKQKIHMEAARVLSFTEAEFLKTLDMSAD